MRRWFTIWLVLLPLALCAQQVADSLQLAADTVMAEPLDTIVEIPVDTISLDTIIEIPVDTISLDTIMEIPVDTIMEIPVDTIVEVPVDPRLAVIAELDSLIASQDERIHSYDYLPRQLEHYHAVRSLYDSALAPGDTALDAHMQAQREWLQMQDSCLVFLSHRASLYNTELSLMPLLDSIGWGDAYRDYALSDPFCWTRGALLRQLAPLRTLLDAVEPVARERQQWQQEEHILQQDAAFYPQLLNPYKNYLIQHPLRVNFVSPASLDTIAEYQGMLRRSQEHCAGYLHRMEQIMRSDTLLTNLLVGKPFFSSYISYCQRAIMAYWQPSLSLESLDSVIYVQRRMPDVLINYLRADSLNQQIILQTPDLPDVLRAYQSYRMQTSDRPTFRRTDDVDAFVVYLEGMQQTQRHCLNYIDACHVWLRESAFVSDSLRRCGLSSPYQKFARTVSLAWAPDCTTAHLQAGAAIQQLYLEAGQRLTTIQQRADSIYTICGHCRDVELTYRQLYQSYDSDPILFTRNDFSALQRQYAQMEQDQRSCIRFVALRDSLYVRHQTMHVQLAGHLLAAYEKYYAEQDLHWSPLSKNNSLRAIMPVQDSLLEASILDKMMQAQMLECIEASKSYASLQQSYLDYQSAMIAPLQLHGMADVQSYMQKLRRFLYDQRIFIGFAGTRVRVSEGHRRVIDRTSHLEKVQTAYLQYYDSIHLDWLGPADWGTRLDSVCMVQAAFVQAAATTDSLFAGVDELQSLADDMHATDVTKLYVPHFRQYTFAPVVSSYDDIVRYNTYLRRIMDEQNNAVSFVMLRQNLLDKQNNLDAQMRSYMRMRSACRTLFKSWDTGYSVGSNCLIRLQQYDRVLEQLSAILRSPDIKQLSAEFKSSKDARQVQQKIEQLAARL